MPIKYLGLKDLEDTEVAYLKKIVDKGYDKLQRHIGQLGKTELTVNVKKRNDEGRASVFEIFLKLSSQNVSHGTFDVRNEEWDIKKAAHGALDALTGFVKHSLKTK